MHFVQMVATIKVLLRSKKITYGMLARELKMSESGVKKLLNAKDCSFQKISAIASVLGITVAELLDATQKKEIKDFEFTNQQEDFLLKNRRHLYFYWKLTVERLTVREIEKIYNINKSVSQKIIFDLDKLGLIGLFPGNKLKIPKSTLIRWAGKGPLMSWIDRNWSQSLLEKSLFHRDRKDYLYRLIFYQFRPETLQEFGLCLNKLVDEFSIRSERESLAAERQSLKPISFLISAIPESFVDRV